jgi:hypothetical protein
VPGEIRFKSKGKRICNHRNHLKKNQLFFPRDQSLEGSVEINQVGFGNPNGVRRINAVIGEFQKWNILCLKRIKKI